MRFFEQRSREDDEFVYKKEPQNLGPRSNMYNRFFRKPSD